MSAFSGRGYAFGIEPPTHHCLGDLVARERGEMIRLQGQEDRRYDSTFRSLDGAIEIATAEARIRAIASQPESDFPPPSGQFRRLRG